MSPLGGVLCEGMCHFTLSQLSSTSFCTNKSQARARQEKSISSAGSSPVGAYLVQWTHPQILAIDWRRMEERSPRSQKRARLHILRFKTV